MRKGPPRRRPPRLQAKNPPKVLHPKRKRVRKIKIICGLGNPGRAYTQTKHNVGFWVTQRLADHWGSPYRKQWNSRLAEAIVKGQPVLLCQPQTYMNESGRAVIQILERSGVRPSDLLVVVDDVALPVGTLRLRAQGSTGGHRGLESITNALGTPRFSRLRIGIWEPDQPPLEDLAPYVLSEFRPRWQPPVEQSITQACLAVQTWVVEGVEKAAASAAGSKRATDLRPRRV